MLRRSVEIATQSGHSEARGRYLAYERTLGASHPKPDSSIAARLQELTKDYGCQLVVSEIVAATAGVEMGEFPLREVTVRGRAEPLAVRIVGAMNELVA